MRRRALALLLSLTLSAALAADLQPVLVTPQDVILKSDQPVRYMFDAATRTLILQGARPTQTFTLPGTLTVEQTSDSTQLRLPPGAQYGLLADDHLIRIQLPGIAGSPAVAPLGPVPSLATPDSPEALISTSPLGPVIPRLLRLENADPKTVAALLSKFYPRAQVDIDERQHALLVSATPDVHLAIDQTIKALDADLPQVMFEAEVIEVNRDVTQSLGIDYDDIFSFKLLEDGPTGLFKFGKVNRATGLSLNIGINALKNSGAAKVLAQPRVTTLDGVEAVINSTQSTPILITGSQSGSIQTITTGITMRLTPRVTPAGYIEAELVISVSTPTGSTASGVPQFSSREARTTVKVMNGEPIAIGGLIENRQVTSDQKVPFLGDIPILGALFTTTRTEQRHSDLIIIVTPRLVLRN